MNEDLENELSEKIKNEFKSKKLFYQKIKKEAYEVNLLLEEFSIAHDDWAQSGQNEQGAKVSWKISKDSPIHTVRVDGLIKASVFNLLAVLLEVELYETWIPSKMGLGFKFAHLLSDIDRFKKNVHFGLSLPWPLANRDSHVFGYGVDLLDSGKVLAVIRSFECEPSYSQQELNLFDNEDVSESHSNENIVNPELLDGWVRVLVHQGGFLLTPIDENSTEISFLFNIDPKIPIIPISLINWALKNFAFMGLSILEKTSLEIEDENSPYYKKINEKDGIYSFLKERLETINKKE